jgi:Tfp pilus assembly protein PilV
MMRWNLQDRHGALLLDVVVAIFILSVGLLAVVGLFIQVTQAGKTLARQEQAACLALQAMEEWRNLAAEDNSAADLASVAGNEQLNRDGIIFERVTTFQLRTDLDPHGHLAEVAVRLNWTEGGHSQSYTLLTYFVVDTPLENLR